MASKIEWCDMTWNPVWGCLGKCPYCYARRISNRFGLQIALKSMSEYPSNESRRIAEKAVKLFNPTWIDDNYVRPFPTKPSIIFVNSMSDACWWKKEWIDAVVERIKDYPMHLFVFLTKRPDLLLKNYHWETRPRNIIIGVTSTTQKEIDNVDRHVYTRFYSTLINIEPMHGKIELDPVRLFYTTWIILGAETGNRKGKILPQKEWIASIMRQCSASRIPLFMKDNLRQVWYGEMVQNRIAF